MFVLLFCLQVGEMKDSISADEKENLCCCEFRSVSGQRSHILALCCDCETVDLAFERLITCKTLPPKACTKIMLTISDRLRYPWCDGQGARRMDPEVMLAVLLMPFTMFVASQGWLCTVFVFSLLIIGFVFICMRKLNSGPQSKFFFTWAVISFIFLICVFELEVVPYLEILFTENFLLMCLVSIMCVCAYYAKLRYSPASMVKAANESWNTVTIPLTDQDQCRKCEICVGNQPPRSSHCKICGFCIHRRDHHFIWLDTCIGSSNHRIFIIGLVSLILACLYGANLTLTTICHPTLFYGAFLLPDDCTDVYGDIHIAICFASALYALMVSAFCTLTLVQQIWLVCNNTTFQEWKHGHFGLYSKGVLKNFAEFCFGYQ